MMHHSQLGKVGAKSVHGYLDPQQKSLAFTYTPRGSVTSPLVTAARLRPSSCAHCAQRHVLPVMSDGASGIERSGTASAALSSQHNTSRAAVTNATMQRGHAAPNVDRDQLSQTVSTSQATAPSPRFGLSRRAFGGLSAAALAVAFMPETAIGVPFSDEQKKLVWEPRSELPVRASGGVEYPPRFVTYLARFLLNYDAGSRQWWSDQSSSLPLGVSRAALVELRIKQFEQFSQSVQARLLQHSVFRHVERQWQTTRSTALLPF
eukprot:6199400-Pleurochrysis_carterae.AAC.2